MDRPTRSFGSNGGKQVPLNGLTGAPQQLIWISGAVVVRSMDDPSPSLGAACGSTILGRSTFAPLGLRAGAKVYRA